MHHPAWCFFLCITKHPTVLQQLIPLWLSGRIWHGNICTGVAVEWGKCGRNTAPLMDYLRLIGVAVSAALVAKKIPGTEGDGDFLQKRCATPLRLHQLINDHSFEWKLLLDIYLHLNAVTFFHQRLVLIENCIFLYHSIDDELCFIYRYRYIFPID